MAKVAIIGCGYVGVCTALALAEHGHIVTAFDVDPRRLDALRSGQVPFREPRVDDLLRKHLRSKRFRTATNLAEALGETDLAILAVGTPSRADGSIDLSQIEGAATQIGRFLRTRKGFYTVVVKSTVVPGTLESAVVPTLARESGKLLGTGFGAASNPEFLKEGAAMTDALKPDRVVIGSLDPRSRKAVGALYGKLKCPVLETDPRTAEMIKYAANSFLAAKVALSNEMANLAEAVGVDWYDVIQGIGPDPRIGPLFLRAGVGFGGSCFPKDLAAVTHLGRANGTPLEILETVLGHNARQPLVALRLLKSAVGPLAGKKVALLGVAFKPDTDDVRETRALPIYEALIREGAEVVIYDPQAAENFRRLAPDARFAKSLEDALRGVEAAVVQTEWAEFRAFSPARMRSLMRRPIVVDGRRTFDPKKMRKAGIDYRAVGLGRRPDGPGTAR